MCRALRRRRGALPPTVVVPDRYLAIAAALVGASDLRRALTEYGALRCEVDDDIEQCLGDIDAAHRLLFGSPAHADLIRAAAAGWADTLQSRYNRISCLDPLTGLGSLQHAQAEIANLYRATSSSSRNEVPESFALALVDLPPPRPELRKELTAAETAMRYLTVGELIRARLPEANAPARIRPQRIASLVRRSPELLEHLAMMRNELDGALSLTPSHGVSRVWTEALPADPDSARRRLDELAR